MPRLDKQKSKQEPDEPCTNPIPSGMPETESDPHREEREPPPIDPDPPKHIR